LRTRSARGPKERGKNFRKEGKGLRKERTGKLHNERFGAQALSVSPVGPGVDGKEKSTVCQKKPPRGVKGN